MALGLDGTRVACQSFPIWSPDSTRIALQSCRNSGVEVYVMNAEGTGVTRLSDDSAVDFTPARWPLP